MGQDALGEPLWGRKWGELGRGAFRVTDGLARRGTPGGDGWRARTGPGPGRGARGASGASPRAKQRTGRHQRGRSPCRRSVAAVRPGRECSGAPDSGLQIGEPELRAGGRARRRPGLSRAPRSPRAPPTAALPAALQRRARSYSDGSCAPCPPHGRGGPRMGLSAPAARSCRPRAAVKPGGARASAVTPCPGPCAL